MKNITFLLVFSFFFGFVYLVATFSEAKTNNENNYYWFLGILLLMLVLRLAFPKLKELGIGTVDFIPNLYRLIKGK